MGLHIPDLKLGFISAGMKEHQGFVGLSFGLMFQFIKDMDKSDHVKCLSPIWRSLNKFVSYREEAKHIFVYIVFNGHIHHSRLKPVFLRRQ